MSNTYFGSEVNISKAFGKYPSFTLEIKVADAFWGENERLFTFDAANLPNQEVVPCSNNSCRRGGLSLTNLLDKMSEQEHGEISSSVRCLGDEGSAQGRRVGKSCTYNFTYKLCW